MLTLTKAPAARTANYLPAMPEREGFIPLPFHVMSTVTRTCVHCGEEPIWETYAEYLDHYAENYEGEWLSGAYSPDPEDEFDYFASTCLSTPRHAEANGY